MEPRRGFEPRSSHYKCDALPIELWRRENIARKLLGFELRSPLLFPGTLRTAEIIIPSVGKVFRASRRAYSYASVRPLLIHRSRYSNPPHNVIPRIDLRNPYTRSRCLPRASTPRIFGCRGSIFKIRSNEPRTRARRNARAHTKERVHARRKDVGTLACRAIRR